MTLRAAWMHHNASHHSRKKNPKNHERQNTVGFKSDYRDLPHTHLTHCVFFLFNLQSVKCKVKRQETKSNKIKFKKKIRCQKRGWWMDGGDDVQWKGTESTIVLIFIHLSSRGSVSNGTNINEQTTKTASENFEVKESCLIDH